MEKQSDKKITWMIKTFSSLQSEIVQSDIVVVGRCRWRLKAYPKGDNKAYHFSLYLGVADSEYLPLGWRRHAKFSLTVVNQFTEKLSQLGETQQWFDKTNPVWGFSEMISLDELHDKEGFLVNGEVKIVVKVDVLEVQGKVDVSEESSPVMETIDVNGFQVLPWQVESVNRMFEKHQDIASNFRPKNPYLKTAYMNVLLSLTQTICHSPWEISNDDLAEEYAALSYLTAEGFQLDWLGKKLDEVKEKKQKEKACLAQLQELEEELKPLKRKYSEMEAQMDKVKAELSAAKYPVSVYN
ncbi:MATH domain and coiled-coil domain-containing protein At2g05410-like [Raphanus sativus]|uniref:MATH domain and coiled-coil domain-containing protein At2g05410-like n=1 Tax=Raphanus sativus TaxID=3726 RepID=A0A9W3D375_RAPSA|nr:MATH domain and coiled-coil domain-containing protein At2g05410-like [Raphanus sativus]XP_056857884.1 MATH domain and coiled-coil domain-containing protein At2g05410-like [Raphanus sativus]